MEDCNHSYPNGKTCCKCNHPRPSNNKVPQYKIREMERSLMQELAPTVLAEMFKIGGKVNE